MPKRFTFLLLFLGALSFALYAALARMPHTLAHGAAPGQAFSFAALLGALFVLLLLVIFALKYFTPAARTTATEAIIIFGFALAFRFALLPHSPWLSNDIYRYLWDAHLLQNGVNPYLHPPEAPELEAWKTDEIYPSLSHKHVPTVYPPLLQILFWLGKSAGEYAGVGGMFGLKLVFVLIDVLLVAALFRILPRLHLDARWAILYAWHPLPIIEIAGNGHSDGVGVFFMLWAIAALQNNRVYRGAILLALAFIVKFLSILLLPFLFLLENQRKKTWLAVALFAVIVCGSYLPFLAAGKNLFSGLLIYSAKWRFNDGLFSLLYTPIHALLPDAVVTFLMVPREWVITTEVLTTRRTDLALLITKTAMALLFLCLYAYVWLRSRQRVGLGRALPWANLTLLLFAAFLLLSPTLHPWYLLWVLPLLSLTLPSSWHALPQVMSKSPVAPAAAEPGVLPQACVEQLWLFLVILTGTVFFSYWVLTGFSRTGVWREQNWIKGVEFGVPLLLAWLCAKSMARRTPDPPQSRPGAAAVSFVAAHKI